MKRFQKILYVSEGIYDETDGLKQALSQARNNKAELTVLIITPDLPKEMSDYKDRFEKSVAKEMRASIQKTAEAIEIQAKEIDFSIEIQHNKTPAVTIIQTVLRESHDLIIKEAGTSRDEKGFKALDMQLLRKCPCPVWLYRPITKPRDQIKVAVAIDPESEEKTADALSQKMLVLGQSLAENCSGDLQIISCWDLEYEGFMRTNAFAPVPEKEIQDAAARAQHQHYSALQKIIDKSDIDQKNAKVQHFRGKPEESIPKFVKEHQIDILVMGTVARTGIPGWIMGNTSERIVQNLTCSLLALKPNGFVSPVKAY